jgi:hypothetical protein
VRVTPPPRRSPFRTVLLGGALATGLGLLMVVLAAGPASAHGVGGIQPTNYRTTVAPVTPATRGVVVRSVDLGNRLELENGTSHDVVVLGYDGEPYLRVGPRGTYENTHSPAVYLNRSTSTIPQKLPATADANAAPVWRKVSSSPTARWHDHRAHWMGTSVPAVVARDRGASHLIQRFTIRLRTEGHTLSAHGAVLWEPGPSPWPWVGFAVALVIGGFVVARSRHWARDTAIALGVLIVAETVHVLGVWGATTQSQWSDLAQSAYSIGGIVLAAIALERLVHRGGYAAAPLVLCAGLFLAIAGGLADVTTLSHSQLPTTIPDVVTRLAVATVLGLGTGVAVVAALHLRAQPRRARPAPGRSDAAPAGASSAATSTTDPALRDALRERSRSGGVV